MNIADEIYHQIQHLPDGIGREVLEFVHYLKKRHGLIHEPPQNKINTPHGCIHTIRENPEDEVWNDLLFGQSGFDAVSPRRSEHSRERKAEGDNR
jgi:hypothetical protein